MSGPFFSYGLLVAIVAAGPGSVVGQGTSYVTRSGGSLQYAGQAFRFTGFNMRGACHYGYGDVLPFSHTADLAADLDFVHSTKGKVIRVCCPYDGISQTATGNRLQVLLDACQARGLFALVALTDVYRDTHLHPRGDTGYYTVVGCCGLTMLDYSWYQSGYQVNYLPEVLYLANRFKSHPAVFAWQIGNELRDFTSAATFVTFCQNVASQIRGVDANHMVSAGLINYASGNLSYSQALQLYGSMDFVNTHNYDGADSQDDLNVANELNLPYVVDEAGFSGTAGPARVAATDADIAKWLGRGADGYMHWGLMALSSDNGDGDQQFGIDPVFHSADYVSYRDLYQAWGASLELPVPLTVSPLSISHTLSHGESLPAEAINLSLSSGAVHFTITGTSDWTTVSPAVGMLSTSATAVQIAYTTASLPVGTYSENLTIAADGVSNSPQVVPITLVVKPLVIGDIDGDLDVDQEDFGILQACILGGLVPQDDPKCRLARLDGDGDVDANDVVLFQQCFGGPNQPVKPECMK